VTRTGRGGICRYVLAKTTPEDQAALPKAIANANLDVLRAFAADALEYSNDMPHTLLHFVVDEQFQVAGVVFASPYVANAITERFVRRSQADISALLTATEGENKFGALRGLLFEDVAHDALQRGGAFAFVPLAPAPGAATAITIQANLTMVMFRTAQEFGSVVAPGVYARPAAKNYATVDAVLVPLDATAPVMFLQMTVSTDHPIKHAALQRMRENLPAALKGRPVQFVFVVPEDVAVNFKKQPFHTVQHTVMVNPPADVPQHLLVVRLATQPN